MSSNEESRTAKSLREASQEERRLLKEEQEAELNLLEAHERLSSAIARLEQEQARVERRRARVAAAAETLREKQEARAAGPKTTPVSKLPKGTDTPPKAIPARDDTTSRKQTEEAGLRSEDNRPP
jgi:hypothetical protein